MRQLLLLGGVVAALVIAGVLFAAVGRGGGGADEAAVRADLEAAGCTLQAVKAQPGRHSLTADGTAKWNTDPPTNGPHFGFDASGQLGTVVWGAYDEPLQVARVIHNLEHGGIYIFYGDEVSDSVVDQLRGFYDDHKNGTLLAPYPKLGDKVALGAWVAEGEDAKGYLAKCSAFDEGAFSSFFEAFQFKGPERFSSGSMLPGDN
ncbi:MAG TPA: DUF3105 domain-containing protein [Gaiellaceae bacterium]|nr:DUF3105 domain-containing protein [Gaiellaceae bacterium]